MRTPARSMAFRFPYYCRASFGTLGANVPAMIRAIVACGWFGIQTWIGGAAIFAIAVRPLPVTNAPGASCRGLHDGAIRLLRALLAHQHRSDLRRHRIDPHPPQHQSAAADRARPHAARLGIQPRRRLRADALIAESRSIPAARGKASSGTSSRPRSPA